MTGQSVEAVLKAHRDELMALLGVVGTGVGLCDGAPCIKVYLVRPPLPEDNSIPACIDGYSVGIEVTGAVEARRDE